MFFYTMYRLLAIQNLDLCPRKDFKQLNLHKYVNMDISYSFDEKNITAVLRLLKTALVM